MNRKKKINSILKKRLKKINAKLTAPANKAKYISKAEREKIEAKENEQVIANDPLLND